MVTIEKNDGVVEAVLRGKSGGYIIVVNEPIVSRDAYIGDGQTRLVLRGASLNGATVLLDGHHPIMTQGLLKEKLAPHLIECGNSGWKKDYTFEVEYDRAIVPGAPTSYRSMFRRFNTSTSQMAENLVMAHYGGVRAKANQKGYDGIITTRDGTHIRMEVKSKELNWDTRVVVFSEPQYEMADYLTYAGILQCGIVWEAWTLKLSTIKELGLAVCYPKPDGKGKFYRINVHAGDKSFRSLTDEQMGHIYHWLSVKDPITS